METFLFIFKWAMVIITVAVLIYFILKKAGPLVGSLGALTSGGNKSIVMAIVMLAFIGVVSYYIYSKYPGPIAVILIALHFWVTYKAFDGGVKQTFAGWLKVGAIATFYVGLYMMGPGQMLVNDIKAVEQVTQAKAAAGEGFFTGNGGLFSDGEPDCENMTGVIRQTPTTFTLRKDCVTYLDAALLKYGKDEIFYDIEQIDAKLTGRRPGEFVHESGWVRKDGRWVFKLVPNASAFGTADSVPMLAYSAPLK